MIKLLLILGIVLAAYWLGKHSALYGRKKEEDKRPEVSENVIDIEPED